MVDFNWVCGIGSNFSLIFCFTFTIKLYFAEESKFPNKDKQKAVTSFMALTIVFIFLSVIFSYYSIISSIKYAKHQDNIRSKIGQQELSLNQSHQAIKAVAYEKNHSGSEIETELKVRIRGMYNLDHTIRAKRSKLIKSFKGFYFDILDLEKSIKKSGLTFTESLDNQTVSGQLRLLQRKKAYSEQLTVINKQLVAGINDLTIKMDEAYTDLQMIETLGQAEAGRLMVKIDKTLRQYQSYADDKIIDKSRLRLRPLKAIWNEARK